MKEIKIEAPKGKVIQQEQTDNGIVVRFVDEWAPKDGDVVYFSDDRYTCVGIYSKKTNSDYYPYALYCSIGRSCESDEWELEYKWNCRESDDIFRPATTEEQKQLFDALAKEGKKWNAEKKQIENIEQDILVPEGINIIRDEYRLGIINGDQVLYYSTHCDWVVYTNTIRRGLKCKLVKCEWDDLKVGDVFYCCAYNLEGIDKLTRYKIKLDDEFYVYWWDNGVTARDYEWNFYYKVVPL